MRPAWLLCLNLTLLVSGSVRSEEPSLKQDPPKPSSRTERKIEGLNRPHRRPTSRRPRRRVGKTALRFLESKLADITVVVPKEHLKKLQSVVIVLDLSHGELGPMPYHPSRE
jgi:hypothetical protein